MIRIFLAIYLPKAKIRKLKPPAGTHFFRQMNLFIIENRYCIDVGYCDDCSPIPFWMLACQECVRRCPRECKKTSETKSAIERFDKTLELQNNLAESVKVILKWPLRRWNIKVITEAPSSLFLSSTSPQFYGNIFSLLLLQAALPPPPHPTLATTAWQFEHENLRACGKTTRNSQCHGRRRFSPSPFRYI